MRVVAYGSSRDNTDTMIDRQDARRLIVACPKWYKSDVVLLSSDNRSAQGSFGQLEDTAFRFVTSSNLVMFVLI